MELPWSAVQGTSADYDAVTARIADAQQALDDIVESKRSEFVAAGAGKTLVNRIKVCSTVYRCARTCWTNDALL